MTILKGIAVTLDLIFLVIFLAAMFWELDEKNMNPLAVTFYILLEMGFVVNAAVIFKL